MVLRFVPSLPGPSEAGWREGCRQEEKWDSEAGSTVKCHRQQDMLAGSRGTWQDSGNSNLDKVKTWIPMHVHHQTMGDLKLF